MAREGLGASQVSALAEAAAKIVEDENGRVIKTESWGLRSLAYRIAKNRKAHYVMLEIDAPANAVAELERRTQVNDDVIRYMTLKMNDRERELIMRPAIDSRRTEADSNRGLPSRSEGNETTAEKVTAGAVAGAAVGSVIGLAGGPIGALLGSAVGAAIGAIGSKAANGDEQAS